MLQEGDPVIKPLNYHTFSTDNLQPFLDQMQLDGHPFEKEVFMIVLEQATDGDLSDIISHGDVDCHQGRWIAKCVARCLAFLNESKRVVHGDVKARNFVSLGRGRGFAAVDLGASVCVNEELSAAACSTGCVPPELASFILSQSTSTVRPDLDVQRAELQRRLATACGENVSTDVLQDILDALKILNLHQECTVDAVLATPQFDMWSFGVLLYQLATRQSLFRVDSRENVVSGTELQTISEWTETYKRERLACIPHGWPKGLIHHLLQKDPAHRPSSWDRIINTLERDDTVTSGRQIFISYAKESSNAFKIILAALAMKGFEVFDPINFVDPSHETMAAEVQRSCLVLSIVCPAYFKSMYCSTEARAALDGKITIIPVFDGDKYTHSPESSQVLGWKDEDSPEFDAEARKYVFKQNLVRGVDTCDQKRALETLIARILKFAPQALSTAPQCEAQSVE